VNFLYPYSVTLILYNTLTKREEPFETVESRKVRMYTCGPTVYGRPHVGNYSSFLMADLLRRCLEASGYEVKQVKNITDVGHLAQDQDQGMDKVEEQARREKLDPLVIARKYTEQFLEDERALNILEPFARPRATEVVPEMIAMINELMEKGQAYETEDGVYFSVQTFPHYGRLSGNTLEDLVAGARVEVSAEKRHPADFALWKKCVGANVNHILRWPSPWGEGFPGWHIECSAMAQKFLGSRLDIHTGGEDNIFPHHECEIAQSEGATGAHPFVRFWIHKRRIEIDMREAEQRRSAAQTLSGPSTRPSPGSGLAQDTSTESRSAKMSKSLGNVLTVPDVISEGFDPLDLRYFLLSVHYRTHLKFSWEGMGAARTARRRIMEWIREVGDWQGGGEQGPSPAEVHAWSEKFTKAMDHDLNTPAALAVVFDCMTWSRKKQAWGAETLEALRSFIALLKRTFGCFESTEVAIPPEIQVLLQKRETARARSDFAEGDRIRREIHRAGYEVRDTPEGPRVKPTRGGTPHRRSLP